MFLSESLDKYAKCSASFGLRQSFLRRNCQLPAAEPGMFILWEVSSERTSCMGTTATSATDKNAALIKSQEALSPEVLK
jgi:hypothetical protein